MNVVKLIEIKLNEQGNKKTCIILENNQKCEKNIEDLILFIRQGNEVKHAYLENDELYFKPPKGKWQDLVGQSFNEWTVLEYLGHSYWKCQCSCGNIKSINGGHLLNGTSKSCGHTLKNQFKDLTGQTFGDWTVLNYVGNRYWNCKCSCGNEKLVNGQSLINGESTSCGHNTTGFKDLAGQVFGEWTVLSYAGNQYWNCRCSCGVEKLVHSQKLRLHLSKSCGHDYIMEDLTGQVFGEWTVLEYVGDYKWLCECSCSKKCIVNANSLKSNKSRSCGHLLGINNIIGKTFGDLIVLSYEGESKWKCHCICGNTTIVSTGNLQTHKTVSCGHCGKEAWQVEALRSREKFISILNQAYIKLGNLLTLEEIAEFFNISKGYASGVVIKHNAQSYVQYIKPGTSGQEQTLTSFIDSLNIKVEQHNRKLLNGFELDLYIPRHNLAIEYNGVYWHSSLFKDKDYHINKTLSCKEKDVHLIHIFEHEWINPVQQEKIKTLLKSYLNIDQQIIYARQTEIKELNKNISKEFLNTYHLQGNTPCEIALGLYYNNELIQVMTFGKPRFNREYDTELLRLCSKAGYKIIGGASKLFKHYIKEHPTETVISYNDLSKFTGKVYEQIGMVYNGLTGPSYTYINSQTFEVLNRLSCTKANLVKQGYGTEEQTEEEIMRNRGYYKLYNCGNARYVYKPNKV